VRRAAKRVLAAVWTAIAVSAAARPARAEPPSPANAEVRQSSGPVVGASVGAITPLLQSKWPFDDPPALGPGPSVGISAGYRWGGVYVGAAYGHAFFGSETWSQKTTTFRTISAGGDTLALDLMAFTAPEASVSAVFHVSAGWRFIGAQMDSGPGAPPWQMTASNVNVRLLGVGLSVRTGGLRIVPEASLEIGPLTPFASLTLTAFFDPGAASRP
jgi:hypothetical protein